MFVEHLPPLICLRLHLLTRGACEVCFLCDATKGAANDVHMCYTDTSDSAPYWASLYVTEPWSSRPSYAGLRAFHISMVVPDLLHVFNLGVGQHVAGGVLKRLLTERTAFPGNDLDTRMRAATASLRAYARTHQFHLRMKKITKKRLRWTRGYPELASSGYDCFVVLSWLEEVLDLHKAVYPELYTLCWSSNKSMRLLYANKTYFLSDDERRTLRFLGQVFCSCYVALAHAAIQECKMYWRCVPKLHLLVHVYSARRKINPARYSTWMDEDFLRKTSKTLGLTAASGAQLRFLQRWVLQVPGTLDRLHSSGQ